MDVLQQECERRDVVLYVGVCSGSTSKTRAHVFRSVQTLKTFITSLPR